MIKKKLFFTLGFAAIVCSLYLVWKNRLPEIRPELGGPTVEPCRAVRRHFNVLLLFNLSLAAILKLRWKAQRRIRGSSHFTRFNSMGS